jgi:hypothetical protein
MVGLSVSASLVGVLNTVAGKSKRSERRSLTLLLGGLSQQLSYDFSANCVTLGEKRERAEAHMSLVMALRTIWAITPERLFTAVDPNFERMAQDSLKTLGGSLDPPSVHSLGIIFRRLRQNHQDGRRGLTSLDLSRPRQRALLNEQGGRCALCRYAFSDYEIGYDANDFEDELSTQSRELLPGEAALDRYHRRPVLDHIIPQFLGGDDPDNWQILCQSCNIGKGEGLAWIMRRGFLPPARPSETMQVSPSLRHAVLSNHYATTYNGNVESTVSGELRLFRKDATRLPVFDNLTVSADSP